MTAIDPGAITIVILRAPGYSGATWVNLVLASHPDALALGPPERICTLPPEQAGQACFVHREACPLWPAFLAEGDHRGRFFRDLAAATGKRVFVLNYPSRAIVEREIDGQGFRVRHVKLVRDGRANVYSYLRHKGLDMGADLPAAITGWLLAKWDLIDRKVPQAPGGHMLLRHEDLVLDPVATLASVGPFIGLDYPDDAVAVWRHDHHLTAGNTGVIDLLCRLSGHPGHWHRRQAAYTAMVRRLSRDPGAPVLDTGWEKAFRRRERLVFDTLAGERNAAFGYPRDAFSAAERARCRQALEEPAPAWRGAWWQQFRQVLRRAGKSAP